ncbi:hypothetical protein D478_27656 [Brevibacillus agri BAB-2500]|nr:hypothetical protein D478_27656 [Brevibacillus agri BAB-2500]
MDLFALLKKIPSIYANNPFSNIGKIYRIAADGFEEIKATFETIERYQDIDEAAGVGLDRIGRDVLQAREQMADEAYRQMIKTKVRANLSPGDIETINEIANVLIGESFMGVMEMWRVTNHPSAGEDAALLIILKRESLAPLPYKALKRVAAGGVRLYFSVAEEKDSVEYSDAVAKVHISTYQACDTFCAGGEYEL